ncbi:MAG: hypothetical protein ABIR21_06980 [Chthoniobacterales bacterium]
MKTNGPATLLPDGFSLFLLNFALENGAWIGTDCEKMDVTDDSKTAAVCMSVPGFMKWIEQHDSRRCLKALLLIRISATFCVPFDRN